MKKIFIIFILLFINLNASSFYKLIKDYKKTYNLYINGEKEKANEEFKKIFLKLYKIYETNDENPIINYYIGKMFFKGLGVKQNLKEAENFLEKAYQLGTDKAACELYIIKKINKESDISNMKKLEDLKSTILNTEYIKKYCFKNYKSYLNLLK